MCYSQILTLWPAEYQIMETFLVVDKMSQLVDRLWFCEEEGSAVQVSSLWPLTFWLSHEWAVILWARSVFLNEELHGNSNSVFCCQPYLFLWHFTVRLLCCSPAEFQHAWWTRLPQCCWFGLGSADCARASPGENWRQSEVEVCHWWFLKRFFLFSWPLHVIHAVLAMWGMFISITNFK